MMKKDISANLYQKCLILCSKILLNVLHNMSLTVKPCGKEGILLLLSSTVLRNKMFFVII